MPDRCLQYFGARLLILQLLELKQNYKKRTNYHIRYTKSLSCYDDQHKPKTDFPAIKL